MPGPPDYSTAPAMPLMEFVVTVYPRGLGTTVDVIDKMIAGNERARLAWDQAVRGEHGGARNPEGMNQHTKADKGADEVKADNVRLDQKEPRERDSSYGTSTDAGLRRLDKAAQGGNGKAAELLAHVLDPDDAMTVHGACVTMGWRDNDEKDANASAEPIRCADGSSQDGLASEHPDGATQAAGAGPAHR